MGSWPENAPTPGVAVTDSAPPRAVPDRSGPAPRRGRPPRIDRAAIAQAASEIPLSDLSLRSVADRLGVSVPGLYHYVQGRDELFALAAEQSVRRWPLPED